jgi:hypothetical protein
MFVLEIIGCWMVLSCTAGPLFAWAFFDRAPQAHRRQRAGRSDSFQRGCDIRQLPRSCMVEFPTSDGCEIRPADLTMW